VGGGDNNQDWKNWNDLVPGQLRKEIEQAFKDAPGGVYHALEVKVENPISEYRVIGPTV
jgi:hypothetical protein